MKRMDQFMAGENATLTDEQKLYIQKEVIAAAQRQLIGRKLLGTDMTPVLGIGVQDYKYYLKEDMAGATLRYTFVDNADVGERAATTVQLPILQRDFYIERRDLESSRREGTPLDIDDAKDCAYQVALLEDDLILQGWSADGTNYDIDGFYQAALNDYSTTKDFATAGNAIAAVAGGKALLRADKIYPPYNLVLADTQYEQLEGSIFTGGVEEYEKVKRMLHGGDIFGSPALTAGTGMLVSAPGRGKFKFIRAVDFATEMEQEALRDGGGVYGRVFDIGYLAIYDGNCICKLSDI